MEGVTTTYTKQTRIKSKTMGVVIKKKERKRKRKERMIKAATNRPRTKT